MDNGKIWMDGTLVPWNEAKVRVLTHTLHYGVGVFEGIRCYACYVAEGPGENLFIVRRGKVKTPKSIVDCGMRIAE